MKILPTIYVSQILEHCGPACLEMVLPEYGIKKSQIEIGKEMGKQIGRGFTSQEIVDYVKSLGLEAELNEHGTKEDIIKSIDEQKPPILYQWSHFGDDPHEHFRVAIGYEEGGIIVHDPYLGKNMHLRDYMLDVLWDVTGKKTAIKIKK